MEYHEPITVHQEHELTAAQSAYFKKQHRLGLPLSDRITGASLFGSTIGFLLGASHGGKKEGLRFRAENAHRLPKSQRDWYFYHKSKNYAAMLGGVKEGLKMGIRTGVWVGAFVVLEAATDHNRGYGGQQDFVSTTIAGVTTAALWSAWHRFPAATTIRTTKLGLKIGLGLGLLEDALGYARGRQLTYIEYGKRLFGSSRRRDDDD